MGVLGTPANSTGSKIVIWQLSKEWVPGPEATVHIRGMGSLPPAGAPANPAVFEQAALLWGQPTNAWQKPAGGAAQPKPICTHCYWKCLKDFITSYLLSLAGENVSALLPFRTGNLDFPLGFFKDQLIEIPTPGVINLCVSWPLRLVYFTLSKHEHSLCAGGLCYAWGGSSYRRNDRH